MPVSFPSSPEQGCGARLAALGQRLRQAREAQGLSATTLADRLRLGVEQLEALESADRERLPEPVFVIAQARRVAAALQLDVTADLQALRASGELAPRPRPSLLRPPHSVQVAPAQPRADAAAAPERRVLPDRRPALGLHPAAGRTLAVGSALLLAGAAVWGGWRLVGGPRVPQGSPPPQFAAAQSAAAPTSRPATAAVPAGMVLLASREPSWVEVRRPDGEILFQGLLQGSRLFPLGQGLEVMAGRPDLVSSRIGSAPAETLGSISDLRWRSLPARR